MQITVPKDMKQSRFNHTTAVLQLSSDLLKLVTFGGCSSVPRNPKSSDDWPKLSNTIISELSELECVLYMNVWSSITRCMYTHSLVISHRGAGTGPAGPASAGPIITNVFGFFSAVK